MQNDGDMFDEKHGEWITYYVNGNKRSEGRYNRGKKDGFWIEYWPNGNKMSECCYVQDIPTGLCTAYYKNGRRELQGHCIETTSASLDGTKEGVWCHYADDGETLWRKSTYRQGHIIQDEALGEWPERSEHGYESKFLMLPYDPQRAPADVLVRYLAVFHRFLTAICYTVVNDKPGMFLVGWLAQKLREVPEMLWYCDAHYYHSPSVVSRGLEGSPESIRHLAAPERLVTDCRRILCAEDGARELGLCDDLADLDLAPLPKMWVYLDLLYQACQSMSLIDKYGARSSAIRRAMDRLLVVYHERVTGKLFCGYTYKPWKGLERVWTAEAQAKAVANRRIAEVLLPVPQALVRWS